VALIVPPLFDQLPPLTQVVPRGLDRFRAWFETLRSRIPGQADDEISIFTQLTQQLPDFISRVFGNFYDLFTYSVEIILNLLLVLVVTIMLLALLSLALCWAFLSGEWLRFKHCSKSD
jgi:predicted PurR-regulated permease PerM